MDLDEKALSAPQDDLAWERRQRSVLLLCVVLFLALWIFCPLQAQTCPPGPDAAPAPAPAPAAKVTTPAAAPLSLQVKLDAGQATLQGVVPNEAVRDRILDRASAAYGSERVISKLVVGSQIAPAEWVALLPALSAALPRELDGATLTVEGNDVTLAGEVHGEADASAQDLQEARAALVQRLAALGAGRLIVRDHLALLPSPAADVPGLQARLDERLAGAGIEFGAGSAELAPAGAARLDEIAGMLKAAPGARVEIAGHTDDQGDPQENLELSRARAREVRRYLIAQGVPAAALTATGYGAQRPVADNGTPEGRHRNRRIELRVSAPDGR